MNEGLVVIDNYIECDYVTNKYIKYLEDNNTLNLINFVEKLYIRENNEFRFKIDFKNNIFGYTLKENDIYIEDSINCNLTYKDNIIDLKYNLDGEEKEIIIYLL